MWDMTDIYALWTTEAIGSIAAIETTEAIEAIEAVGRGAPLS